MKEYKTQNIRNIALVSHSSAGKTMLAEAFLHFTGATTRLGRIEDGSTVSDYEEEEIRRGISLSTSVIPVEFNDHKINFLDTPGYTDFVGEVISALRIVDGAMVVVDAVAGTEVGTELAWDYCDEFKEIINEYERESKNNHRRAYYYCSFQFWVRYCLSNFLRVLYIDHSKKDKLFLCI